MKDKIKNILKNNRLYLLTFLIGIIVISVLFKLNNVTPLGDNSLLCVDFYHQYGPMLAEMHDRIMGHENLIYSFNMAMGLPFFRNFLNYLSSPFNIILLFFNHDNVITSFSFIIGIKAVAAMTSMVYYLSKKFNTKKLYLIPFGVIYAFSAYFSAYYWNIMWLDGMFFLPLITLGIENIVNTGKWKLYTFSLALMLIANYFIGYMICIFSVIYFLIYLASKLEYKKDKIKENFKKVLNKGIKFAITSLIAGLLTAGLLLPMFVSLKSISATGGEIPTTQYYSFAFMDFIKSHITGVNTTVFASDELTYPNISCGILSVAGLLLYLVNMEIPWKKKICYGLALGFVIFAFFSPQLDFILHAFHVPNDLPYRYSFLYSFLLVIISAYALLNIKKLKFPLIAGCYIFIMSLLLALTLDNWAGITTNMIYINMILLTLYFIFYCALYFIDKLHNLFYLAIIIVSCIDVSVAINYNWDISQVLETFYSDYDTTKELLQYVKDNDDELFYRIENTNMMTLNDGSWYDYYGQTTFSSMAYESMANLQHSLGIPGNQINSYYYVQSTPIYDLMFDIKYFIGLRNDYNRYDEIKTAEENVNRFKYNVGLMFGVNDSLKDWQYESYNPFEMQNEFIERSTGVQGVLEESLQIGVDEVYRDDSTLVLKYTYENKFDNMYFYANEYSIDFILVGDCVYYQNDRYQTITTYSDELTYSYLEDYDEEKVININSSEDTLTFYVAYNYYYTNGFLLYTINNDKLESAYNILKNHKLDMTEFKEHEIKGNITLEDNMAVYTSIPYDDGWHVYVDGKETKTYALAEALLLFDCPEGTHEITLKYKAPYMNLGFIISLLTLSGIIIYEIRNKQKKKFQ